MKMSKQEEAFWAKCRAEAEPEVPLTDEQMYQVECQIKQGKIDRAFNEEPRGFPKKRGIWGG